MSSQGRFIVVEGLEGAGKSSVVDGIIEFLKKHHIPCLQTREPGGTKIGECLRRLIKTGCEDEVLLPQSELLLLYAARIQLLEQVIRPALAAGKWVVADRFELSTFAYQGGGRQLDVQTIELISAFCLQGFQPDCTFFLDIMPDAGLHRAATRGEMDKIEQESQAFFSRVYHAYQERIAHMQDVLVVNASKPLDEVMATITSHLEQNVLPHAVS